MVIESKQYPLGVTLIAIAILLASCSTVVQPPAAGLQNGDIIFHTSSSGQSQVIQLATGSEFSHCGIIYKEEQKTYVIEAVQPVKRTPFEEFVKRGENNIYVVKRLKNADSILSASVLRDMKKEAQKMIGKNYDSEFGWTDNQIYCSELVWKVYQRAAGIELVKLKKLRDYDFSNREVQSTLNKRYKNGIPWEEPMISPGDIFESPHLITVEE
jgi:uncharacterized protein YycO